MQVFLNGQFVDKDKALISPMDRGFLFGDGLYEVIPCFQSRPIGLLLHLNRMNSGLQEIGINYQADASHWLDIIERLSAQFSVSTVGVYFHISRGTDEKRNHAFPENIKPTIFAYAYEIPPSQSPDPNIAKGYDVMTGEDLRWQRCHVKSTSLLGNVLHVQQSRNAHKDEIILYNKQQFITEASTCNVFVVKNKIIMTPKLDNQILAGITRNILLQSLAKAGGFTVLEQNVSREQLANADEVWLTSSSKEVGAVIKVDDRILGDGKPGPVWETAFAAFNTYKFLL